MEPKSRSIVAPAEEGKEMAATLTAGKRFRLKNTMIIANVISNFIGVAVAISVSRQTWLMQIGFPKIHLIFLPVSFAVPIVISLVYENPIRRYLELRFQGLPAPRELALRARQKLLNEPFFLIALDAAVWVSAAVVYSVYFWALDFPRQTVIFAASLSLQVGLVTVVAAFFVSEFFMQRRLAPYYFPNGGLSSIPETIRIRISTRLIAFLAAINLIPLLSIVRSGWVIVHSGADPQTALAALNTMAFHRAMMFAAIGVGLTLLVSSNLTRPLAKITDVLHKIRTGEFESSVAVTSNDELGYVGDVINEMTTGLKEREWIKETFGKYVSKEIRDEVLSGRIPLDGEIRDVSVLFADLRNYTPLVEKTSPQQVVRIINRYFEEMEKAIRAHGGLIVQFIGDEIEAVFGAPIPLDDHATQALLAAEAMNAGLERVNRDLAHQGYSPLQHGIGIHSGQVVAANIGSPSRLSYALVGDTVNVASRLQDVNKQHGTSIIVSAETRRRLSRAMPLRLLPETSLKGKAESMRVYGI